MTPSPIKDRYRFLLSAGTAHMIAHTPTPQRGQSIFLGTGMAQFTVQPEVLMAIPMGVGMVQFSVQPEVIMTTPLAQLVSYHIVILGFSYPGR